MQTIGFGSRMQYPGPENDTSSSKTTDAQHGSKQAADWTFGTNLCSTALNGFITRVLRVGRHLILPVLRICSRCGCQGNEESNTEWLWSVIAASAPPYFSCSSEPGVIWLVPRSASLGFNRMEERSAGHGDGRISRFWFGFFCYLCPSNVADGAHPGACRRNDHS